MMGVTDDPNDPALTRGVDDEPVPMAEKYLVLSDAERAKGFVRPLRRSYVHVGPPGPEHPTHPVGEDDLYQQGSTGEPYVLFEEYPESERPKTGRYWTRAQLDAVGKGCGTVTTMGLAIAETYARHPQFYGATFCVGCSMHRPVGEAGEFVWDDGSGERVGT